MTTSDREGKTVEAVDLNATPHQARTLLVGMPGTGKTSYLGLLYCSIVDNGPGDGPLLAAFDQDRVYLNRIAKRLQVGLPAERTLVSDRHGLDLTLLMPGVAEPMVLGVPDLSGETWEAVHQDRVISAAVRDQALNATGFMVFVNVDKFRVTPTVEESRAAAVDLGLEEKDWAEREPSASPRDPSSSQVALVDIIQELAKIRGGRFRLSLMLSAFDAVLPIGSVGPGQWVTRNAPLLAQYLDVNMSSIHTRIYGVSAQGGDYAADEATVNEIVDRTLLERAFVLNGEGSRVTIHEPLLWALGDD